MDVTRSVLENSIDDLRELIKNDTWNLNWFKKKMEETEMTLASHQLMLAKLEAK